MAFSSPTYWVKEGQDDFVRIVVERTGGGYGRVLVNYTLQHLTTTPADLHATAYYTSSQTLIFDEGVVQVSPHAFHMIYMINIVLCCFVTPRSYGRYLAHHCLVVICYSYLCIFCCGDTRSRSW